MNDYLQFLRKQEQSAMAYITSLNEAAKQKVAEIKKYNMSVAREIKRLTR